METPLVRLSLDKLTLLLHRQFLAHRHCLSLAAAMATTELLSCGYKFLPVCTYFLFIYKHRGRLRLPVPNLIRHRALTRDFKLRDRPKRRGHGLDYQFTIAIATASVYFMMSHVTITISSTTVTIIEFPKKNIDSYNNDPIGRLGNLIVFS